MSPKEHLAIIRKKRMPREAGTGDTVYVPESAANRKTGDILVTMTDARSCPTSCALRNRGCYAEAAHTRMWWQRVPNIGVSWSAFCSQISALSEGTVWRHNEAGDLPGIGERLDVEKLDQLVNANRGRRGFTFTHKPLRTSAEREAIRSANENGFTINLSANDLTDADRLADLKIGPVAVVVPADAPAKGIRTPDGRTVVICLAQTTPGRTCATCELCSKQRKSVVGFRLHGQAAGIAASFVKLRRSKDAAS